MPIRDLTTSLFLPVSMDLSPAPFNEIVHWSDLVFNEELLQKLNRRLERRHVDWNRLNEIAVNATLEKYDLID